MKAKPTYWELLLCTNWKDMKNFQTINEMSKVNVSIRHAYQIVKIRFLTYRPDLAN